jgi:PTH1 family peptidyl-tRNA hydrolase
LYLLVGLGNPGSKYSFTRHNIGWNAVARAASQWAISLSPSSLGHIGQGRLGNISVTLMLPLSWMNLSGDVVKPLLSEFGVSPDHLIVVHDDLDLPVGRMRVKFGGGTGGHNGLLSIITALEADGFYRLKLGVGRPAPNQETANYVLAPFDDSELSSINAMLDRSVDALQCLVVDGPAEAMNRFNQRAQE